MLHVDTSGDINHTHVNVFIEMTSDIFSIRNVYVSCTPHFVSLMTILMVENRHYQWYYLAQYIS